MPSAYASCLILAQHAACSMQHAAACTSMQHAHAHSDATCLMPDAPCSMLHAACCMLQTHRASSIEQRSSSTSMGLFCACALHCALRHGKCFVLCTAICHSDSDAELQLQLQMRFAIIDLRFAICALGSWRCGYALSSASAL